MAGEPDVGKQGYYHLQGLPLDWTETDLLSALESLDESEIQFVQMLTKNVYLGPNRKLVIASGEAIVAFKGSWMDFMNDLPKWSKPIAESTNGPTQVQIRMLVLPDDSKDPQLALLCNPTRKAMMGGDNLQRELFYDWHSRTIKAREVILRSNYELYASYTQAGKDVSGPITKGSASGTRNKPGPIRFVAAKTLDPHEIKISHRRHSGKGRLLRLLYLHNGVPCFTFNENYGVSKAPTEQPTIDDKASSTFEGSSANLLLEEALFENASEKSSRSVTPQLDPPVMVYNPEEELELLGDLSKIQLKDDTVVPPSTSVVENSPTVIYVEGMFTGTDIVDMERFFCDKLEARLAFAGRYKTTVEATSDGRPSYKLDIPQTDGVVVFEDVKLEELCLETETFEWDFPIPDGEKTTRRVRVSRMTDNDKIAKVLEVYYLQKSITDSMTYSELINFDIDYRHIMTASHKGMMFERSSSESLQKEGYKIRTDARDILNVEWKWLKSQEKPKPAPLYVSGVYFKTNAHHLARYFETEMKGSVRYCALYSKLVKGKRSNGDLTLRIPQGDAIIMFENIAVQEECLQKCKFFPDNLPLLPSGKRRYMFVNKVCGANLTLDVLDAYALKQSAQEGLNFTQRLELSQLYQNMITEYHDNLLKNLSILNRLRTEEKVIFEDVKCFILDHHREWWIARRNINKMILEEPRL